MAEDSDHDRILNLPKDPQRNTCADNPQPAPSRADQPYGPAATPKFMPAFDYALSTIEHHTRSDNPHRSADELYDEITGLHELYDSLPAGLFTIRDDVIIAANVHAASLLNIRPAALPGRKFSSFVGVEFRKAYYDHAAAARRLPRTKARCRVAVVPVGSQAALPVTLESRVMLNGDSMVLMWPGTGQMRISPPEGAVYATRLEMAKPPGRADSTVASEGVPPGYGRLQVLDRGESGRRWLETVIETIPGGVVIIEKPAGRVSYINKRARELYGMDLVGVEIEKHSIAARLLRPDGLLFPPEELPASRALFKGEEVTGEELIIEHADGKRIWVLASAAPLFDEHSNIVAAVGIFMDVSRLKAARDELDSSRSAMRLLLDDLASSNLQLSEQVARAMSAERSLRQGQDRFKLAAEAANSLVYELDLLKGQVVDMYGPVSFLGYMPNEAPHTLVWFLEQLHPDDSPWMRTKIAETLSHRQDYDLEYRLRHKDGHYITVHDRGIIVRDADGRAIRQIGSMADVTEHKATLAALEEGRQLMETLIGDLAEANSKLQGEVDKRAEFIRALAHELKTPLTAMYASITALQASLDQGLTRDFALTLEKGALHLNSRIDELLDLAKTDMGMLSLERAQVPPERILREAIDIMSPMAAGRKQELRLDIEPQLPDIWADEGRLRQVLYNLIGNACKYIEDGGSILLKAYTKTNDLVVEVIDDGPGLPPSRKSEIFDPYKITRTRGRRTGGLGLGLPLSKSLIELHGGKMWLLSEPGKGCTVGFSIPTGQPVYRTRLPSNPSGIENDHGSPGLP